MSQNIRLEKLEQLLVEMPKDSFLHFAIGLECLKMEQFAKAELHFESIVKNDPNYCGVYYHLGKLYEKQANTQKALAIYEAGLVVCKKASETHLWNELRGAVDALDE
jgi:uncharacterized protein HemY